MSKADELERAAKELPTVGQWEPIPHRLLVKTQTLLRDAIAHIRTLEAQPSRWPSAWRIRQVNGHVHFTENPDLARYMESNGSEITPYCTRPPAPACEDALKALAICKRAGVDLNRGEHVVYDHICDMQARINSLEETASDNASQRDGVEQQRDSLYYCLRLILPMAKGYAAQNRVGNNAEFIEQAEAACRAMKGVKHE